MAERHDRLTFFSNEEKQSKIGFYVDYNWDFNLTHEIVFFLEQIAKNIEHRLIPYYKTRASYLLERAEIQSKHVDDFSERDRLYRMRDASPEMYDELYEVLQFMKGNSRYESDEFANYARSIEELLARIDGKEKQ